MRFPHSTTLVLTVALLIALPLLAQTPNGTINGIVLDPSNRVISGADILVINDVTGVQYFSKTNEEGVYVAPNLPPGVYRLQVSKPGFKTLVKPDIVVNVQDLLSINFTLPVGAAFDTLTVQGGAPLVNTESASVSTVVDQKYVENMPLNGRSFQDLILLTPGIVTQSPQNSAALGEFSVNGQREESNYYSVDGVSANVSAAPLFGSTQTSAASGSLGASTALGTTQALVSVDDLREFRVQSSTYSAEYGRNPGGQFAFETKSGTNQWHGTTYDYLRNGALDANDWFNDYFHLPESPIRQNDFGATFGGPVKVPGWYSGKNKTFFFASYEGLRLTAPQAATSSFVPDASLRSTTVSPLNEVLNLFPIPNGPDDPSNGIAQFIGTWSNFSAIDSGSIRLDHAVSDKLRVFFRFSETASDSSNRGGSSTTPSMRNITDYMLRTYTGGATTMFTNRLNNEFRINYTSNDVQGRTIVDAFGGNTPADLRQLTGLGSNSETDIFLLYNGYFLQLFQSQASGAQRQWNLIDTLTLVTGHHQFKFGIDYRRLSPFVVPATPVVYYFYFSENAVQTNNSSLIYPQAYAPGHPLYQNFSAYAQDEWRLSPRLNVSLGLRWEFNPAPSVTRGLRPYTVEGNSPNTWTLAPQGTPLWNTTWYNFAPRVGIAYTAQNTSGRETVIRGGAGLFFDTGQQLGSIGFNGPGFAAVSCCGSGPFPSAAVIPTITNPPVGPFINVFAFEHHLQLPYTLQWNGSIEQALGKSQVVSASYVGSHAARLLQNNFFLPASNPIATEFLFVQNGLTSDYESLQLQFRRRLSGGLTALGSYSWSHCLDYGSEDYTFGYRRGNCDFDVRHNLSAAFSYDVPNVGTNRLLGGVLHHWGLDDRFSFRTAFPVSLNGEASVNSVTAQQFYAGLNLAPGEPIYLYGANCASTLQSLGNLAPGQDCPGGKAINPNAFTNVTSGFGDAPRNFARGFGAWQMNLAVRREFPIRDTLRLQFRAEAFNLLNHPNFGTINPQFGQKTFGQATTTLANSGGILNSLYRTGGPRSMQFALKLIF